MLLLINTIVITFNNNINNCGAGYTVWLKFYANIFETVHSRFAKMLCKATETKFVILNSCGSYFNPF